MSEYNPNRRDFLARCGILTAAAAASTHLFADERPPVTNPRATDGDDRFEPDWDERLTITVGEKTGDLVGSDDKVLQAAVDYVARLGGGTVRVLPGTYTSAQRRRAAVADSADRQRTRIRHHEDRVRNRRTGRRFRLVRSGNHAARREGFPSRRRHRAASEESGQRRQHGHQADAGRAVGNRFKLNDGLRENLWLSGKPTCSSLFPLLTSEHTADVVIENLTLDGNRANNENFNGNYGGCIFLQDCNRYTIRSVTARNYNGDGISFQICHDVVVEDCHSHDNADLGVHPGSGSQRPLIRNNRLERNNQGLFWCWGVKYGLAEGNTIDGNRLYGISIGHNDTDNVMRNNVISNSGQIGILFRDDARGQDFWANRNVIENNRIVNSGGDDGVAIDVTGQTKDITITGNEIRDDRRSDAAHGHPHRRERGQGDAGGQHNRRCRDGDC